MNEQTLGSHNFEQEVLTSEVPVIVDFWSPHCIPCLRLAPVIGQLAEESDGSYKVGKVNADEEPDLVSRYNVMSIPTVKVFLNGRVISTSIGMLSARKIREMVDDAKDSAKRDPLGKSRASQGLGSMAPAASPSVLPASIDKAALTKLGYGLYAVTSNDGVKDNALIVNAVSQVTDTPTRISITLNKQSYSYRVILETGIMNINCLSTTAPFSVFEAYGFKSGKNVDKFSNLNPLRSKNGLIILPQYINAFLSLRVEQYIDLGTHMMFICRVTESRVLSGEESMTYNYYQKYVKRSPAVGNAAPKAVPDRPAFTSGDAAGMASPDAAAPDPAAKARYECQVCGYIYEGNGMPDDFTCPVCGHGADSFRPIG